MAGVVRFHLLDLEASFTRELVWPATRAGQFRGGTIEDEAILRDGRWFSAVRRALDAYVDETPAALTGTARLSLSILGSRLIGHRLERYDSESTPSLS